MGKEDGGRDSATWTSPAGSGLAIPAGALGLLQQRSGPAGKATAFSTGERLAMREPPRPPTLGGISRLGSQSSPQSVLSPPRVGGPGGLLAPLTGQTNSTVDPTTPAAGSRGVAIGPQPVHDSARAGRRCALQPVGRYRATRPRWSERRQTPAARRSTRGT